MEILFFLPELSKLTCATCKKYLPGPGYSLLTRTQRNEHGQWVKLPIARDKGDPPPPCGDCPKIDKTDYPLHDPRRGPHLAAELTSRDWQVIAHYFECKAVGKFPDDPIVTRHAAILSRLEDERKHLEVKHRLESIGQLLGGKF